MINLVARLSRSVPLLVALVLLALIIYFVVSWRSSPTRAKEVLIRVFTVLCSALAIFFILASTTLIIGSPPQRRQRRTEALPSSAQMPSGGSMTSGAGSGRRSSL